MASTPNFKNNWLPPFEFLLMRTIKIAFIIGVLWMMYYNIFCVPTGYSAFHLKSIKGVVQEKEIDVARGSKTFYIYMKPLSHELIDKPLWMKTENNMMSANFYLLKNMGIAGDSLYEFIQVGDTLTTFTLQDEVIINTSKGVRKFTGHPPADMQTEE